MENSDRVKLDITYFDAKSRAIELLELLNS